MLHDLETVFHACMILAGMAVVSRERLPGLQTVAAPLVPSDYVLLATQPSCEDSTSPLATVKQPPVVFCALTVSAGLLRRKEGSRQGRRGPLGEASSREKLSRPQLRSH